MPRRVLVRNASRFCRACGRAMVHREGFAWCSSVSLEGQGCRQLPWRDRLFCEHCGRESGEGARLCAGCGRAAHSP